MMWLPKFAVILLVSFVLCMPTHASPIDGTGRVIFSEISTEDIIEEYHMRLQRVDEEIVGPFFDSLTPATSDLRLSMEEKAELKGHVATLISELSPFAEVGEQGPTLLLAQILLDEGLGLIEADTCRGLSLLYDVAKSDDGTAATGIANYFNRKSDIVDDPQAKKTQLYWAKEAAHRNPDLSFAFDIETKNMDESEVAEIVAAWVDWSPKTDPGVQEEITNVCGD